MSFHTAFGQPCLNATISFQIPNPFTTARRSKPTLLLTHFSPQPGSLFPTLSPSTSLFHSAAREAVPRNRLQQRDLTGGRRGARLSVLLLRPRTSVSSISSPRSLVVELKHNSSWSSARVEGTIRYLIARTHAHTHTHTHTLTLSHAHMLMLMLLYLRAHTHPHPH